MRIVFLEPAHREMEEAIAYYNAHQSGLGDAFRKIIDETLSLISEMPLLFPTAHDPIRKAVLKRFPYTLFYSVDTLNETVIVVAVAHQHKKPQSFV